jgi:polysaccharide pyruvyl transferase CsaB
MPPVIGIVGSYGGLNTGDEAILASSIAQLRAALPTAEIVVFSRNAEHTRAHHPVDRAVNARSPLLFQLQPEVQRLNLLLLGGGGILYDKEAGAYLRVVGLAHELSVPTFAFAVGIGPLTNREDQEAVRTQLNCMAGVTVRELSARRVCDEIGVSVPVEVTADPALLLQSTPFTDEMLVREAIPTDRRLIGFSIRERGGAAPALDKTGYHNLMADVADFCIRRYEAEIVFVPMERADRKEMHLVMSHMVHSDRAHVLHQPYEPSAILGLVSRFDLVAAMRLHFLIFAALHGVPLLALPYAPKVQDLIASLGMEHEVSIETARAGTFLAVLDRLWHDRAAQQQRIAERLPLLQQLARQTVPKALAVIGCGPGANAVEAPSTGEQLASAPIAY